jgi:glucan biosynthesis protein C
MMQCQQGQARLFYLDNLRALAMVAGLFFHAALAYSPMAHQIWPSADPLQHAWFDVFAWASHLFRMPLFFLIAGFFAAFMLHKKGEVVFIKNRMLKIGLPFLLFLPLLTMLMAVVVQFGIAYVQQQPPFLLYFQNLITQADPVEMPFSTMHLWFLYHLLFLYVLTWSARILVGATLANWLLTRPPHYLLIMLIFACIPALFAVSVPFPAPEWIFPALWALWFYGVFFAVGYGFFRRPALLLDFDPMRQQLWLAGVVSYGIYYYLLPNTLLPETQPQGLMKLLMTLLEAISAVTWTIASLLYARRWLDIKNKVLSYLSDVSYWVYLIHLPLLFFVQYLIIDLPLSIFVKYLVASVGTLALCLMSFHLLISWNWLATLLSHRKVAVSK